MSIKPSNARLERCKWLSAIPVPRSGERAYSQPARVNLLDLETQISRIASRLPSPHCIYCGKLRKSCSTRAMSFLMSARSGSSTWPMGVMLGVLALSTSSRSRCCTCSRTIK